MLQVDNVDVTERAWAIFRQQRTRNPAYASRVIALHFMPSFVNADGSNVEGFAPGYTIDFVDHIPTGEGWMQARLPDGSAYYFMPKFDWRVDKRYVTDQASAYTLAIRPA
jgi:hypothetical protein